MHLNKRLLIISSLLILTYSNCSSKKKKPELLVPLAEVPFGQSHEKIEALMKSRSWELKESSEEVLKFQYPSDTLENGTVTAELYEPAAITFYFKDKRLLMVTQRINGPAGQLDVLQGTFIDSNSLRPGVKQPSTQEKKSPTGNIIREERSVFTGPDLLVRLFRERVQPVEEKMKQSVNDQLEIQAFSTIENQGITEEALLSDQ